jgi:hypothetical protein
MHVPKTLIALATATTLALTGAATASAATATLSIVGTNCQGGDGRYYDYTLRVSGTTRGYAYGSHVDVYLKGSDEWFDDDLGGPWGRDFGDYQWGYSIDFCVNSSTLDEDWGEDEVYAAVRVYDRATGALKEKVNSNQIHGYF